MAKSDSICRELQLDFGILINRINRAELYYELKNFQKAQLELVQVEKDLPQYNNPKLQIDYYELSYRLYDAIGNSQLANSMFRAYTEKKEQYFGDLPRSIIAEWELASKNEKSIQDSTKFKLHKEQQSKEKYIIILVSALLLLAFLLFYLIRNRKNILEREKINKEKQLIKFDLELKSKQLVSESLKSITIQNTKEELLHQLEEVIQELPKIHHTKFQQIIHNLKLNRTSSLLSEFEARFTGVYEQYYDKLKTIAPDLTPHELRICALMRLNIPTKEIAILTNRTTGTVDNTRSTIRKKLKLEDETNLQDYLLKL
jgi:DNA-binding CsgD family transcriptional regulator